MKKLLAIFLSLSLLLCALPTIAEMGAAEDSAHRATVLNEAMLIGTWKYETDETSYVYQFEESGKGTFNINDMRVYGQVEYSLNGDILSVRQESSTSVYFRDFRASADETGIRLVSGEIVLTKENSASEGADDSLGADDDAAVPDDLVGEWTGVGTPKNSGPAIDLTATINADGTGEYTFIQDDYTESYSFTISSDDSAFSVDIPADNYLGIARCGGTWALEDGVLKLDITTTFSSGGSYSYTAECEKTEEVQGTSAEAYAHAEAGERVRLDGIAYDLQLFTMAQDNWDLVSASTKNPLPAQGEVYLLRFAVADDGEAVTPETIEDEIAPAMSLYSESEGSASRVFQVVTPDDQATRVFDILFYCENFYALEELELLCDGVLYPLGDLPRDGKKLPLPTAEELAIEALNDLHRRGKDENGTSIDQAACDGDVIVAYYTASGEDANPSQVLTAQSDDDMSFPREYRAESYETARWAAVIYPTRVQVGWYSGIGGGAANQTITWLSLFDLQTGKHYQSRVATVDPPQTITVQTINGIPMSSGASGEFRSEDAIDRLTELVEVARTAPTPEPTEEPTPEPTEEPTPEPTLEPAVESAAEAAGEVPLDDILAALDDETYRATYDALRSGEVVQKGSKGDTAKGVQQTLVAFGQDIAVDGSVGPKTIAALNAVQAAFGLPETEEVDAAGYAELLPRLLVAVNPDEADALLMGQMDAGEYDYMRACALVARGKYASAKALFEESGWGDWEVRAEACVQPWPKTGVLYKNPEVKGSSAELSVQFNTDPDTAMLVKVYTDSGVLARTMFIGGTGKATTSLPAGTYIIKDGVGKTWYGEEEAFGERPEGQYEIMTFEGGSQEVELKKNYRSTITVNVQEDNPSAEGVGSDWESWSDF